MTTSDIEASAIERPDRPEVRAAPRSESRSDDPRARAAARTAALLDNINSLDQGQDKFFIDRASIPEGWDYEWKMRTVVGKEDPSYQTNLARTGWEPVPPSRHPDQMPQGYTGQAIERDGMVLMERPLAITDMVKRKESQKAIEQVRGKEEQLGLAAQGQFARVDAHGRPNVKLGKSFEAPIAIPE